MSEWKADAAARRDVRRAAAEPEVVKGKARRTKPKRCKRASDGIHVYGTPHVTCFERLFVDGFVDGKHGLCIRESRCVNCGKKLLEDGNCQENTGQ